MKCLSKNLSLKDRVLGFKYLGMIDTVFVRKFVSTLEIKIKIS
jgi:hypothetical protein